jgi:hypothetical protein
MSHNSHMRTLRLQLRVSVALFMALPAVEAATKPLPETIEAFERYARVTEDELKNAAGSDNFLNSSLEKRARARSGEIVVTELTRTEGGRKINTPKAMVQDWEGLVFVPGVNLERFRAFLQDYNNYKNYYHPAVMESKLQHREGDRFEVSLRLYKQAILTVVLNVEYRILYSFPRPNRMFVVSRSTRIAEVKQSDRPDTAEYTVQNDRGLLWRLNTYWRVEQADGGVYAQCEAVSLSRDAPLGLGIFLKGFLSHFPKESMVETLRQTREGLTKSAVTGGLQFK